MIQQPTPPRIFSVSLTGFALSLALLGSMVSQSPAAPQKQHPKPRTPVADPVVIDLQGYREILLPAENRNRIHLPSRRTIGFGGCRVRIDRHVAGTMQTPA